MKTNRKIVFRNCSHLASAGWLRIVVPAVFLMLAVTASCDRSCMTAVTEQDAPAVRGNVGSRSEVQQDATVTPTRDENSSPFVEQEIEQLDSPFTKETVLELNAIVSRSLAVIEEFDDVRRRLAVDSDENRAAALKSYNRLTTKTEQACIDMDAASKRLRNSGEKYNKTIFAAMVRFVENVDTEIREEKEDLCAK